jgi:hypothetical protein
MERFDMKKLTVLDRLGITPEKVSMIKSYLRAVFASAVTMGIALIMEMEPQYAILIGSVVAPIAKWADRTEKEYGIGSDD